MTNVFAFPVKSPESKARVAKMATAAKVEIRQRGAEADRDRMKAAAHTEFMHACGRFNPVEQIHRVGREHFCRVMQDWIDMARDIKAEFEQ